MIESIRSLFSSQYRQERKLIEEVTAIVRRLSILNRDTIEEEATILKGRGLNVENVQLPKPHLLIKPLNPRGPSENRHVLGYKLYLNPDPEVPMPYFRQIWEGYPEDVDSSDISVLETSIKDDLRYLRNASKKK